MKEKIKFIILIVIFVCLLFVINKILESNTLKLNLSNETEVGNVNTQQKEVEKTVIDSYDDVSENSNEVKENNNLTANNLTNTDSNVETKDETVIEVTESTFEEEVLKSDKTVLIDFYADWCNPCKILSPIVEEVAKENPDLKVVKIDVDSNTRLSYEYGAYSIPTLVVIKDGKEVNRAVGAIPKASILELIK